jgi:ABC-type transport system substrate-binding protein
MVDFFKKTFSFLNFNLGKIKAVLRLPARYQLKQFFKILNKREKIAFLFFFFLFLASGIFLSLNFYFQNTGLRPAPGGIYIEGLVGQPRFINPIYAPANDVDRDLTELIFSGLMRYDSQGQIVPDLAKEYEIKEGGKVYEFTLKEEVFWHDGQPFSADDVVFTVKIIQDPDYNSRLRASLFGVTVEKMAESKVRFRLKNPYAPFLETLTFKILPKHIWQDISLENFPLAIYNFKPIGTGPFKFKSLEKDDRTGYIGSLSLVRNGNYFDKEPYLSEISFLFFEKEQDLIAAYKKGGIKGLSYISANNLEIIKEDFEVYHFSFPRYFDISFNPEKSEILAEKEVREALNYGTNKTAILAEVLSGHGKIINSPFVSEIYNLPSPEGYQFDQELAKEILESASWKDEDNDGKREKIIKEEQEILFERDLKVKSQGQDVRNLQTCLAKDPEVYPEGEITGYFGEKTEAAVIRFQEKYAKDILEPWGFKRGTGIVSKTTRAKLNEICLDQPKEVLPLKFSLVVIDQEELSQVAKLIKEQWEALGVELEIKKVSSSGSPSSFEQDFIKPRNYESILVGKAMGLIPDPYPFWHSSQRREPGLNLALYKNTKVDEILEEARQTLNEKERLEKYQSFQEILIEDAPVVFLYSPDYLYPVSKEIKGIKDKIIADPSKRFVGIENWYIKTKRAWR